MDYSREDLMDMREQASAVNDTAVVQLIDQALQQNPETQRTRSAVQGLTLGFGDEVEAGLRAPFSDRSYTDIRDEIRGDLGAYQDAYPMESLGLEVGGGLLTGGVGGARALGSNAIRNLPRGRQLMAVGAGESAIAGAGAAEELSDVPLAGITGAGIGAVAGKAGEYLERLLMRTPSSQAGRQVQSALRSGDMTPQEAIAELDRLGEDAMLADISPTMMGKARKVAAEPGPGRDIVQGALNDRQAGMVDRIYDGINARDFNQYLDELDDARRTQSAPSYRAAYAAQIDPTRQMTIARDTKAGTKAWKEAREKYMNRNLFSEADMEDIDLDIQPEMWDYWGRSLQGKQGKAIRAGDNSLAGNIGEIKSLADADIYQQIPELQEARRIARGPLSAQDAAEEGLKLFGGGGRPWQIERRLRDMSAQELEAYRRGAVQGLVDKLDASVNDANAARNLIKSDKIRNQLRLTFPDNPAGQREYDRFIDLLEREAEMGTTFSSINRGSRTAFVEAEIDDMAPMLDAAHGLAQGRLSDTVGNFLRGLTGSSRYSERTSRELGGLLTQQGPGARHGLMDSLRSTQVNPAVAGGLLSTTSTPQQRFWND